ncbi:MAG TPA: molybdopterin-dependent oxidoreductase, partial [Chloroflexota bacterium]
VGDEAWPIRGAGDEKRETGPQSVVSLRWSAHSSPVSHDSQLVVLPITHPYEQSGTVTNLEGRVQELRAGGKRAGEARADWLAVTDLARALGLSAVPEEEQAALA